MDYVSVDHCVQGAPGCLQRCERHPQRCMRLADPQSLGSVHQERYAPKHAAELTYSWVS